VRRPIRPHRTSAPTRPHAVQTSTTQRPLPRFVRTLVGLDLEIARRAFAEFLDGRRLDADQLEFLDLIVDHLTARSVMDPSLLYESPFTDFDSKGVEGVFEPDDVVSLAQVLRSIEPKKAA
jgi:type I restriction enzyme R subunit